ncbi:hypothetical protein MOW14_14785 (plasmid) [Acinetobacter indicus]|uniref:hypothetical protein n=1 Tax=Acinetobacter indicus TaxID=756892 RepID=UPI001FA77221|nr:hypothetical protein [Acinetobacter indicus]UNW11167.1 hypothetical protein MOW14_14785 [Acinetobacter indicus]
MVLLNRLLGKSIVAVIGSAFLLGSCVIPSLNEDPCSRVVNYAILKHKEYRGGKTIPALMKEVDSSNLGQSEKEYRKIIIEILDTFPVWDEAENKQRIDAEIRDHFESICDPKRVNDFFKTIN